jgi:hypothetical protein
MPARNPSSALSNPTGGYRLLGGSTSHTAVFVPSLNGPSLRKEIIRHVKWENSIANKHKKHLTRIFCFHEHSHHRMRNTNPALLDKRRGSEPQPNHSKPCCQHAAPPNGACILIYSLSISYFVLDECVWDSIYTSSDLLLLMYLTRISVHNICNY